MSDYEVFFQNKAIFLFFIYIWLAIFTKQNQKIIMNSCFLKLLLKKFFLLKRFFFIFTLVAITFFMSGCTYHPECIFNSLSSKLSCGGSSDVFRDAKWYANLKEEREKKLELKEFEASLNPLHRAVISGNVIAVKQILKHNKQELQVKTSRGETVLDLAITAEKPSPEIIGMLLDAGAKNFLQLQDGQGETVLDLAVNREDPSLEIVGMLLDAGAKNSLQLKNRREKTVLDLAVTAQNTSPEIVKLLLDAGAKALVLKQNKTPYDYGDTTFRLAAKAPKAKPEIIKLFLDAGAEGFVPPKEGSYIMNSPFGEAVYSGDLALVNAFLQSKKLDPNSTFAAEYLSYALEYRNMNIFNRLLAYGVPINNAHGLLSNIVHLGDINLISSVLKKGYDIRKNGKDALSSAVSSCKFGMANALLDSGAPIENEMGTKPENDFIRLMSTKCKDKDPIFRHIFLKKLVSKGVNINELGMGKNCPAWIGFCQDLHSFPDMDLMKEFTRIGIDPYRINAWYDDSTGEPDKIQKMENPLTMALELEKQHNVDEQDIIDIMISIRPPNLSIDKKGLTEAFSFILNSYCDSLNKYRLYVANKLISYGADFHYVKSHLPSDCIYPKERLDAKSNF